jgi:hypothetical protein
MSDLVEWEEPQGERRDWEAIAEVLRANPKQWAHIKGLSTARHSHYINSGKTIAFRPTGSFQAMVRKGRVFARFVGVEK